MEHECEYWQQDVVIALPDADYRCAVCDCGAVLYIEATAADYAEVAS